MLIPPGEGIDPPGLVKGVVGVFLGDVWYRGCCFRGDMRPPIVAIMGDVGTLKAEQGEL